MVAAAACCLRADAIRWRQGRAAPPRSAVPGRACAGAVRARPPFLTPLANAQTPRAGAAGVGGGDVEVTLLPEELEGLDEAAIKALYEERAAELRVGGWCLVVGGHAHAGPCWRESGVGAAQAARCGAAGGWLLPARRC